MANYQGNPGNKGGGRKGLTDELQIKTLKHLCVTWAIKEMNKKNNKATQRDITLRVISNAIPRELPEQSRTPKFSLLDVIRRVDANKKNMKENVKP